MPQTTEQLAREIAQKGALVLLISPEQPGSRMVQERGIDEEPQYPRGFSGVHWVDPVNSKRPLTSIGFNNIPFTATDYIGSTSIIHNSGPGGPKQQEGFATSEHVLGVPSTKFVNKQVSPARTEIKWKFLKRKIPATYAYQPEVVKARDVIANYNGDENAHSVVWAIVRERTQDGRESAVNMHIELSESLYAKLTEHVKRDPNIMHEIFKTVYPHWASLPLNKLRRNGKVLLTLAKPGTPFRDWLDLQKAGKIVEYKPK